MATRKRIRTRTSRAAGVLAVALLLASLVTGCRDPARQEVSAPASTPAAPSSAPAAPSPALPPAPSSAASALPPAAPAPSPAPALPADHRACTADADCVVAPSLAGLDRLPQPGDTCRGTCFAGIRRDALRRKIQTRRITTSSSVIASLTKP